MMARNLEKDRLPCVLEAGWSICPTCGQWTYMERVQDIIKLRDHYVPDIYHRCLYCGDQVYWYRRGDYDSLLALYQYEARGISHITLEGTVIQALVDEMQFKLKIHTCVPGCECQKARDMIAVLMALRNIKRVEGRPGLAEFILPDRPETKSTAPQPCDLGPGQVQAQAHCGRCEGGCQEKG
jgi:hypothetical protein